MLHDKFNGHLAVVIVEVIIPNGNDHCTSCDYLSSKDNIFFCSLFNQRFKKVSNGEFTKLTKCQKAIKKAKEHVYQYTHYADDRF